MDEYFQRREYDLPVRRQDDGLENPHHRHLRQVQDRPLLGAIHREVRLLETLTAES
jgi:hypothetical protein